MAKIHVDGKQYQVKGSDNLLQACLSLGLDIPYFCWHPALGSVGACRQCAVKHYRDESDENGRIVMACMTPAADDSYISISDAEATDFRESIIEFLMTNHPHDCPVCEEGGHCHLQDMTVMTRHHARHYRFRKRTHLNQDLGPFIGHEMNRCIACYRCVRYYQDYAGGKDLGAFGSAANVYFGRAQDGTLESEFSGNLTEICPTGVFTDQTHSERYTRKWDMQFAPSICGHCAVGCNVSPGERYGEIRRVENRYHGELNGYFLCDRGRFGYGYTNRKDRPDQPIILREGQHLPLSVEQAIEQGCAIVAGAKNIAGIGSPRASLEANTALRTLVGADQFCNGVADQEQALLQTVIELMQGPTATASPSDMEHADAVLILGEDPTQTAPRTALAIRQAARGRMLTEGAQKHIAQWQVIALADLTQQRRHPLMIASPAPTRLDDIASTVVRAAPDDIAQLGFEIAHQLHAQAPTASGLAKDLSNQARAMAKVLSEAQRPLIVSGTGCSNKAVLQAAAQLATALRQIGKAAQLGLSVPEANSIGASMMDGCAISDVLQAAADGEIDTLIVLENDLYRRAPRALVDAALASVRVIAIDHQLHETAAKAALVLPAATIFESDGTLVNYQGRAQRYFQVFDPIYYRAQSAVRESWRWCDALDAKQDWDNLDAITQACAQAMPRFAPIIDAAPDSEFRMNGLKLARASHRYSGRTAMRANQSVHEPRASQDPDSALAFSMEGANGAMAQDRPPELLPFAWAPGWNSPQAWNKFQAEVGGGLRGGDPGQALIKHDPNRSSDYCPVPEPRPVRRWQALRLPAFYGAEELSAGSDVIQQRAGAAFAQMAPQDIRSLGLKSRVRLRCEDFELELPLRACQGLPVGHVGLPVGITELPFLANHATLHVEAAD